MLRRIVRCLLISLILLTCTAAWGGPSIRLEYATFGPAKLQSEIASLQAKGPSSPYRIVQCTGPILPKWRSQIETSGATILGYVPDFAYLVRVDAKSESALKKLPFVRWIGPYLPEYKYHPRLVQSASDEATKMTVVLFDGEDASSVSAGVKSARAAVLAPPSEPRSRIMRVLCKPSDVRRLAESNSVQWVEEYVEPELQNNVARGILNVPSVWSDTGLYGSGQIIAVCDTGLDTGDLATLSPDFLGRVRSAYGRGRPGVWSDPHGHGTHVSGSVLGCGRLSGSTSSGVRSDSLAGVAPSAEIVMQSVLDASGNLGGIPLDLGSLFQQAYDAGARIHTNSWGAIASGEYTADAVEVDRFTWEHKDMLVLFAAGNGGIDGNRDGKIDAGSIKSPATAKNCISVGATESVRASGGYSGTYYDAWRSYFRAPPISTDRISDNAEGLAGFSSRGPCNDGRIKPDLCAPGTNIVSCRSHSSGAGIGWGIYDSNHLYMGGTSMATPIVTGSAALVREYFLSTMGWPSVSAAMVKAALINSAMDITPGQYGTGATQEVAGCPDNSQGWGRVDVESAVLAGAATMDFQDNPAGLLTGDSVTFQYTANAGDSLRFTLAYTDYPALLGTGPKLVNDLDLVVTDPNGVRWYPNRLAARDSTNPVEDVAIPIGSGVSGIYTVTVNGYNVPYGPQPFALVSRVRPGMPDLSGSRMAVSPEEEVRAGQTITYTISVVNRGTPTSNTILSSQIPEGTTYVAGSTTLNGSVLPDVGGSSPVTAGMSISSPGFTPGVVAQSSRAVISFRAIVNAGQPAGSAIENTAEIRADGGVFVSRSVRVRVGQPRVIRVRSGTTGNGSSWQEAIGTIGEALALAGAGDEVWVASGIYPENLAVKPGVALYGGFSGVEDARDQRNWSANRTIIDGRQAGSVVACSPGADSRTRIDGFTICNGYADNGSAINCDGCSPTIASNRIIGNRAASGGIYCRNSSALIINNMIMANTAGCGAAIYSESSAPTILNNTIVENDAQFGAAVYSSASHPTVINNIIAFNSNGICKGSDDPLVLRNNCTYGNTAYDFRGFYVNPANTNGNISADPRLANRSFGNLHIQCSSPCVDSGDDTMGAPAGTDCDNEQRIQGEGIDIGADESNGEDSDGSPIIVRVSTDGYDSNDGATWEHPKRSIQAAIHTVSSCGSGGEIWVKSGLYRQRITLLPYAYLYGGFSGDEDSRSQRNPGASWSVLDGSQSGSVAIAQSGSRWYCIDGFVVRNGSSSYGGGILCYQAASPRIANNVIIGNEAQYSGGGIYCSFASPEISNNRLIGNSAAVNGGAMHFCASASPVIHDNTILGNSAGSTGGGIRCSSASPKIINNTFASNLATTGGGISCDGSSALIANNVIASGSSGISRSISSFPVMSHNLVYGHKGKNYEGWPTDPTGTDGNISSDPLLASTAYGDVHIRWESPCRDAGDSALVEAGWCDVDGESRSIEGRVDIGADECLRDSWSIAPQVIRVSVAGDDANDGSGWASAMHSVQEAIYTASIKGGEVWVGAGVYEERIRLMPYAYAYGGFGGDEAERSRRNWLANVTILDAGRLGRTVTARVGDSFSTIDGFTIRNGYAERGGGIYCNLASPVISNNKICSNTAVYGGGIHCSYASPKISRNIIAENVALSTGGGIDCYSSSPAILGNTIRHNIVYDRAGAGIYCGSPCTSDIVNNLITGNECTYGSCAGILGESSSSPRLVNNAIVGNFAKPDAGAVHLPDTASAQNNIVAFNSAGISGLSILRSNCVFGNAQHDYVGRSPGLDDISADPQFVNRFFGDFHLQPWSPCIDSGDDSGAPTHDKDGSIRPQDGRIGGITACDIGAYERPLDIDGARATYPDGRSVSIGGTSVTAVFPSLGMLYVEKKDRSAGIRVDTTEQFRVGDVVNIMGAMRTDEATGERYVETLSLWPQATGDTYLCDPIAMPIQSLSARPLIPMDLGLGNAGLLVRIWGQVTAVSAFEPDAWIAVDDGSRSQAKVLLPAGSNAAVSLGDWVCVTGLNCSASSFAGYMELVRSVGIESLYRTGR